jgi:adenylate cyclase
MDIQFGHYWLKRAERQLLGPDGPVELAARSFDILRALLERPDAVVGKAELLGSVWPDMVVEDNTLQVHISALRRALAPGMIMTVHGRGYKYAGPRPLDRQHHACRPKTHDCRAAVHQYERRSGPGIFQ